MYAFCNENGCQMYTSQVIGQDVMLPGSQFGQASRYFIRHKAEINDKLPMDTCYSSGT